MTNLSENEHPMWPSWPNELPDSFSPHTTVGPTAEMLWLGQARASEQKPPKGWGSPKQLDMKLRMAVGD